MKWLLSCFLFLACDFEPFTKPLFSTLLRSPSDATQTPARFFLAVVAHVVRATEALHITPALETLASSLVTALLNGLPALL